MTDVLKLYKEIIAQSSIPTNKWVWSIGGNSIYVSTETAAPVVDEALEAAFAAGYEAGKSAKPAKNKTAAKKSAE